MPAIVTKRTEGWQEAVGSVPAQPEAWLRTATVTERRTHREGRAVGKQPAAAGGRRRTGDRELSLADAFDKSRSCTYSVDNRRSVAWSDQPALCRPRQGGQGVYARAVGATAGSGSALCGMRLGRRAASIRWSDNLTFYDVN